GVAGEPGSGVGEDRDGDLTDAAAGDGRQAGTDGVPGSMTEEGDYAGNASQGDGEGVPGPGDGAGGGDLPDLSGLDWTDDQTIALAPQTTGQMTAAPVEPGGRASGQSGRGPWQG